ncbi:MAG: type II secretion system protein [Fimbriimonadales bacterium]|nr:type II secretion system protein [Fimbriimonadales bacterium]
MRRTDGFTILDTLIAVLIIALLAGVLFVALTPSREQARQAACMSNLRQIYAALELYAQENDWAGSLEGLGSLKLIGGSKHLLPYLKSKELFYCPDTPEGAKATWRSTYSWPISAPPDSPGAKMFAEQLRTHGTDTPVVICSIHDEVYYLPRESSTDSALLGRFEIQLCVGGHVRKTRVDQPRSYHFTRGDLSQ